MKPTRLISPPGTYFVTFSTFQRRRFFVVESYARLFLKTLYGYRRQGRFDLHAFVLMPDHVHLLFTPAHDTTLERGVQLIKGGYSHAVGVQISRKEIWQKGFTDHRIRDAQNFAGHRLYIHQNPVKAGLVRSAKDYYWSSFRSFYWHFDEPLAVDHDWWWPDDSEKLSKAMKEMGWYTFGKRRTE